MEVPLLAAPAVYPSSAQPKHKAAAAKVAVHGVVLLDKPIGISSNAALQRVKHLFNACKAGHTGSLDPLASGMLPLCFGEATKLSHYLLEADKTYQFVCQLGQRTTTGDAEGELVESQSIPSVSLAQVEQVLAGFLGPIEQIPPMYSALKHQGKRLYELARQGKEVERPPRLITIKQLSLLALKADHIECRVCCSKGTYIRVLAEEIAAALGTCGHLIALRRESVVPFSNNNMVELAQLEALSQQNPNALFDHLLPVDTALVDWPRLQLNTACAKSVRAGQAVVLEHGSANARIRGRVSLYGPDSQLIGLGEVLANGQLTLRRLVRPG